MRPQDEDVVIQTSTDGVQGSDAGIRPTQRRSTTLLIIPTYNEAGNIERLLREIQTEDLGMDLLVIDDNSPDGTGALLDTLAMQMPLQVIHRPGKLGIGSAHKDGFRYAFEHGYRFIMTMDADFAHLPSSLCAMLAQAEAADVVVGSRYLRGGGLSGWSPLRLLLTHTAHWLTEHLLGLPYDCTGAFRLYKASVLRSLNLGQIRSEGYAFLIETLFQLVRQGRTIRQVAIVINSRNQGESKISRYEILNAVKTLLRLSLERVHGKRGADGLG